MKSKTKALDKIRKARVQLILDFPFFGSLALRLKPQADPSGGGAGTLGVTADKTLYYNPEFVESLNIRDMCIVLCHEIMHLVQRCHSRFPAGGNQMLWNIAADYAVNSAISETKLCNEPNILDKIFPEEAHGVRLREYAKGKSTETMYLDMLRQEFNAPEVNYVWCDGDGHGNEQGESGGEAKNKRNGLGCSSASKMKKVSQRELRELKQDIQAAAAQSRALGKGDMPGYLQEFLAEISKPTVTWKDHLRRAAYESFKGNYTWNRPSRRSEVLRIRLPARKPTPKGAIIVMDTSGSISDEMLRQFLSEVVAIMKTCRCPWVDIYFHDMECYLQETFNKSTIKKLKVRRGGTSHIDVFKKISESKKKVGMVVAFTDLMTCFPDKPDYPVIWAVPSQYMNHSVPWGKKVEVVFND